MKENVLTVFLSLCYYYIKEKIKYFHQNKLNKYKKKKKIFLLKVYFHFYINYTASGIGCGKSFDAFTSDVGCEGKTSSFGSTIETESGRGFLGPVLP